MTLEMKMDEKYEQGREQGLKEGITKGIQQGIELGIGQGLRVQIQKKLNKGKSISQIADECEEYLLIGAQFIGRIRVSKTPELGSIPSAPVIYREGCAEMRGLFCDKPVGYSECQTKR